MKKLLLLIFFFSSSVLAGPKDVACVMSLFGSCTPGADPANSFESFAAAKDFLRQATINLGNPDVVMCEDPDISGVNPCTWSTGSPTQGLRCFYTRDTLSGTDRVCPHAENAAGGVSEFRCADGYIRGSGDLFSCVAGTCPEGTTRSPNGVCLPPEANLPKNSGSTPCGTTPCGNPINPGTGNKYQIETDYTGNGPYPLTFARSYNSLVPTNGNLGSHWRSSYSQSLIIDPNNTQVTAVRPNAREYIFTLNGAQWAPDPDVTGRLIELLDGSSIRIGWEYRTSNDTIETYSADGKLLSLTRRDGLIQTLAYDVAAIDGGDGDANTLDTVTDPAGRTLGFSYDANGRVATVTDPAGAVYTYAYDANDNLASVTYPDETPADPNDNPQRIYHYEDTNFPHALTGITDENGNRFATWGYDAQGRAILSEHAGGTERVDVVYNADGTTTVTDSQGHVETVHFDILHGVVKTGQVDGGPCSGCGDYAGITYDANGFLASRTDFNGNTTTYVHDARGLETSRTEAVGTPQERTITTQWDSVFRLPVQITEPGKITTFTYDAQGRLLERKEEVAP